MRQLLDWNVWVGWIGWLFLDFGYFGTGLEYLTVLFVTLLFAYFSSMFWVLREFFSTYKGLLGVVNNAPTDALLVIGTLVVLNTFCCVTLLSCITGILVLEVNWIVANAFFQICHALAVGATLLYCFYDPDFSMLSEIVDTYAMIVYIYFTAAGLYGALVSLRLAYSMEYLKVESRPELDKSKIDQNKQKIESVNRSRKKMAEERSKKRGLQEDRPELLPEPRPGSRRGSKNFVIFKAAT